MLHHGLTSLQWRNLTILGFTKYIRKYLRRHEKILIVILGKVLKISGTARLIFLFKERIRVNGCYILLYHRVADERHESVSASIENFPRQISFLVKHFSIITMERLINSIKNRKPLPLNSVIITFDDGYKDVFTNAYPALKKHNIPAIVFVTTDYMQSPVNSHQSAIYEMMSWDDIREMADNNISIGSHTVSHPKLSTLADNEIEREAGKSKDIIQRHINREVVFFSYPYGGRDFFNDKIKEILKRQGYQCASSTVYGVNDLNSDLFELKRIPISYYEDETIFMIKVFGLLNPLARFMDRFL